LKTLKYFLEIDLQIQKEYKIAAEKLKGMLGNSRTNNLVHFPSNNELMELNLRIPNEETKQILVNSLPLLMEEIKQLISLARKSYSGLPIDELRQFTPTHLM